jgi:hypothetical protein
MDPMKQLESHVALCMHIHLFCKQLRLQIGHLAHVISTKDGAQDEADEEGDQPYYYGD